MAKIFTMLALLLTAVTGAWAQQETLLTTITPTGDGTYSETTAGAVTVTPAGSFFYSGSSYGWRWDSYGSLTVTANEGYTITRCVFIQQGKNQSVTISEAPFALNFEEWVCLENYIMDGVTSIEVYGTAPAAPAIEVTWDAAAKQATFDMPASDLVLTPIYAPVAQWATESDVALLPTAAEGIFAGTTDPLIVEGTVAPGQGIVMYAVTSTNQATAPELSAFSATVPTAENIADEGADVLVWYYIQGADTPDGQEATAENTFNDSEICATPLEVSVLSNQFDITFNAANANTIESGKATVTVGGTAATVTEGMLEAVKMGSEVKMTAKQGYKFKSVKAEKYVPRTLADATTADVGMVVCAAGHLHAAKTAVPTRCTAVGILGKVTGTGHGLILALKNATNQNWNTINGWTSASYAGTTLKLLPDGARGTNLTSYTTLGETAVSNWAVAQKSDYAAIFANLGSTKGDDKGRTFDGNVNAYITTGVGGTAISGDYWSATSSTDAQAWRFISDYWGRGNKENSKTVRPVLGF